MDNKQTQPFDFESQEFDDWAPDYDDEVNLASGFPFEGYAEVLETIIKQSETSPRMHILDLGTGTGNLAMQFKARDCHVLGSDFSVEMLRRARRKAPGITFLKMDMRDPWLPFNDMRFDRIVSAYALHHFPLQEKIELLITCAQHLSPGGRIVIGDLSFETAEHLDRARVYYQDTWDEEHYWLADQTMAALKQMGWKPSYHQVSDCAGVYCIKPIK